MCRFKNTAAPDPQAVLENNQFAFNDLQALGWLDAANDDLPWQIDEQEDITAKMVAKQAQAQGSKPTGFSDMPMEDVDLYEFFKDDAAACAPMQAQQAQQQQARTLNLGSMQSDLSPNASADSPCSLSASFNHQSPSRDASPQQDVKPMLPAQQQQEPYLSMLAASNQNAMPQAAAAVQMATPASLMQYQQLMMMQNAATMAALAPGQQQQLLQQMQLAPLMGLVQVKQAGKPDAPLLSPAMLADPVERVKEKRREAARRSRARKNCYVRQLEDENRTLKEQVIKLSRTVAKMQAEMRGGSSSAAASALAGLTAAAEGAASAAPADLDLMYACATAAL